MTTIEDIKKISQADQRKTLGFIPRNGLESKTDEFKEKSLSEIKFTLIIKPAIISFIALVFSFFMDLSYVPFLGNISVDIAKVLFPTWQPAQETIAPYSFWWLPVVIYLFFIICAFFAYKKLAIEVARTPASETIDRVINSYTSIIDSVATALPLIGAAILLISIKLGEDIFLGLSVPFEIKALIILAIGKLFEPVLDQLGVEYQNVVNHISEIKEKYFSSIQIENSRKMTEFFNQSLSLQGVQSIPLDELNEYKNLLEKSYSLSKAIKDNFVETASILDKLNSIPSISKENIQEIKSLSESIREASLALNNETTINGLKHLESIVLKK